MQRNKQFSPRNIYFPAKTLDAMKKISGFPLTIVEAPTGYGKTTAVREYLKDTDVKSAWVWIHDSSITVFWKCFCRSFYEIAPEKAQILEELGFPEDSVSRQMTLDLIRSMDFPQDWVLVMDDYHTAASQELDRYIEFLVRNGIPNFHFVLIVRYINLDSIDELKLKQHLLHITKEELEFSPQDIRSYYRLCGVSLRDSDIQKLYDLTEGWISALYLLMLGYIERGNFNTSEDIYKLFESMVYKRLSNEMRGFLESLCFFESFTLEQAAFVSGMNNAEDLLYEILQKNAFIKYDELIKAYKMHNIFTKYLKNVFGSLSEERKRHIYQNTAYFHMKNKDYLSSMEYFYGARNFEGLLTTVEADRGHSIQSEHGETFIRYFKECPVELRRRHPTAMLIYAMCLFSFNEMTLFGEVCEEFEEIISSNDHPDNTKLNDLQGEFELLLAFTEYNDIQKMLEHINRAAELLTHTAKFLDTRGSWTFGSPSVLYMFYRSSGTLSHQVEQIKEAIPVYKRLTNGHGAGADCVMEAEWYFNRADFDSAEILTYQALHAAETCGQGDLVIGAMFLQARIAISSGDYSGAVDILIKMREEMMHKRWYNLMYTIDLCDAFIHAELKQYEKIPARIRDGNINSGSIYFPTRGFFNIIMGRVLLISGDYRKLLGMTEQLIADSSAFPNLLGQIYVYIYVAAANKRLYRHENALAALEQALNIALEDKIYMPFVENGDYIESLLNELRINGRIREDIDRILKLHQAYSAALEQIKTKHFTKNKPRLTQREHEIAELAAEGLSNKQIGEVLFISENTVKVALKSVFNKLSINNRAFLEQALK